MKKNVIIWILLVFCGYGHAQNTTAVVPVQIPISSQYDTIKGKVYFLHTVEKGQTLYSIQKTYNTTLKEIIKESPDDQLLLGETLRIPVNIALSKKSKTEEEESQQGGKSKKTTNVRIFAKPNTDTLRIALLIPLYLDEIDSINPLEKFNKTNDKLFTYLSFYEGALLAWNKQDTNSAVHFELKVYDVTEDSLSVKKALKDPFLAHSNAIISVSFVKSFALLSDFALKHQIPIIHPLSERDHMHLENPYFIQGTPSTSTQIEKWAEYALSKYPKGNFIVLMDKNVFSNKKAKSFYDNLMLGIRSEKTKAENICLYNIADSGFVKFPYHFKENKENIVCAFFEQEITFTNTVINLSKINKKIYFLGTAKWLDFDKTDIKYLQRLNFEYYSPFFAKYKTAEADLFEADFYQDYKTLPNEMAFKGYDYMRAVLEVLSLYNTEFILELDKFTFQGLGSNFEFEKRENGGYENIDISKLKLQNFKFLQQIGNQTE